MDLSYPDFDEFYERSTMHNPNNIYDALAPVLDPEITQPLYTPKLIDVIRPSDWTNGGSLQLLPGHAKIQEYDTRLTIAYKAAEGAVIRGFDNLCEKIINKDKNNKLDYILVDLDPSRGIGNGHLICCCDGLIIPCEADGPSCDAVKDALEWFQKFKSDYDGMMELRKRRDLKVDECRVKLLGSMQSNYTCQEGVNEMYVIAEYAFWMRKIDTVMAESLPALQENGLAFTNAEYEAARVHLDALCLSRTPNWFSLNSFMDRVGVPVAFLRANDIPDPALKKKLHGKTNGIKRQKKILTDARSRVVKLLGGVVDQAEGRPPMETPLKRQAVPAAQQAKRQRQMQQEDSDTSDE